MSSRIFSQEEHGKYETCYVMISWISLKVFFSHSQIEDILSTTRQTMQSLQNELLHSGGVFAAPWYFPLRTFRDNQIAERLIRAFDRISENLCSSCLLNLTDFRSYYCYPKRNRTVKPPKRKLLMTLIMRVYTHTRAHTYGLCFTPDIYQPLD